MGHTFLRQKFNCTTGVHDCEFNSPQSSVEFEGVAVTVGDVGIVCDVAHTDFFVKCMKIDSPVTVAPINNPITNPISRQYNDHFLLLD